MSDRVEPLDRQSAVLEAPIEMPAKAPDMLHWFHHFDGPEAVAFCGFRKVPDSLSTGPSVDCVVCTELRDGGSL